MEISKQFTQLWVRRWTSKWKVFTVFTRLLMKLKTHQMFSVNVAYYYSLTRFMLTQPSWWYLAGSALFLLCKILIGDVWSSFCRRLCCCCHFSWRMCELWCIIIKGSEIKKTLMAGESWRWVKARLIEQPLSSVCVRCEERFSCLLGGGGQRWVPGPAVRRG